MDVNVLVSGQYVKIMPLSVTHPTPESTTITFSVPRQGFARCV